MKSELRPISPSWFAYIIRMLHILKIINTDTASFFWPFVQITSIIGIILIIGKWMTLNSNNISKNYQKYFYVPITEELPKHKKLVDLFAIAYKINLLQNFPKNNKYKKNNLLFFFLYATFACLWYNNRNIP